MSPLPSVMGSTPWKPVFPGCKYQNLAKIDWGDTSYALHCQDPIALTMWIGGKV